MNVPDYAFVSLIFTGAVSFMLWDFMQKGNIFERYGSWVNKEERENNDIIEQINILSDEKTKEAEEAISYLKTCIQKIPAYKKPLGNCLKCFHIWVFLIFFTVFNLSDLIIFHIKEVPIYSILLGVSYVILVKLFFK